MKNWSWSTYVTQQPTEVSNECIHYTAYAGGEGEGGHIADGCVRYTVVTS